MRGILTVGADRSWASERSSGFLVALVNAADPDHDACVAVWSSLRTHLMTVEGVLVEATHVLRRVRGGPRAAARIVFDVGATIVPATPPRTERELALMDKYADVPMDFVDALLVVVAEEEGVRDVLTLDEVTKDVGVLLRCPLRIEREHLRDRRVGHLSATLAVTGACFEKA